MKKLLALSLVLGIASLASAGLDLATVAGLSYEVVGSTVTISGNGVTAFGFNLAADNGSVLSNAVVNAGFTTYKANGQWMGDQWAGATGVNASAVAAGPIFSIDFTPGVQTLNFVYSSAVGAPYVSIGGVDYTLTDYSMTIVPEPMTMGLLGLGSLFLARRKK